MQRGTFFVVYSVFFSVEQRNYNRINHYNSYTCRQCCQLAGYYSTHWVNQKLLQLNSGIAIVASKKTVTKWTNEWPMCLNCQWTWSRWRSLTECLRQSKTAVTCTRWLVCQTWWTSCWTSTIQWLTTPGHCMTSTYRWPLTSFSTGCSMFTTGMLHNMTLLIDTQISTVLIQIPYGLFESYVYHVAAVNIPTKMAASSVISVKRCWLTVCGCKYVANKSYVTNLALWRQYFNKLACLSYCSWTN